jgi:hypothetical protein
MRWTSIPSDKVIVARRICGLIWQFTASQILELYLEDEAQKNFEEKNCTKVDNCVNIPATKCTRKFWGEKEETISTEDEKEEERITENEKERELKLLPQEKYDAKHEVKTLQENTEITPIEDEEISRIADETHSNTK